jgi:hypothetical protein
VCVCWSDCELWARVKVAEAGSRDGDVSSVSWICISMYGGVSACVFVGQNLMRMVRIVVRW